MRQDRPLLQERVRRDRPLHQDRQMRRDQYRQPEQQVRQDRLPHQDQPRPDRHRRLLRDLRPERRRIHRRRGRQNVKRPMSPLHTAAFQAGLISQAFVSVAMLSLTPSLMRM